ncbi:FAD:protein FMN transferase [Cognatishimia sp. WU-CL00825]|uniref:FAD:protein FMN transferase n=1 Tax=Cognatishimia sp. WU-CL00825 TaxID=3127658 RepID=UPI00310784A6
MSVSRRRFLRLASAACLIAPAASVHAFKWQGTALGAHAQIILDHPDAKHITSTALAEIDRLEDIFSLYRKGSEIVRLNQHGTLQAPSFELLECLSVAQQAHRVTEGRFDPTVQQLWAALAESQYKAIDPQTLRAARQAIGFEGMRIDNSRISLGRGQQLTLNGIAQGYIADRLARIMRRLGVADVLIDTGEIIALGTPKGLSGWPVTIAGTTKPRALSGRALATSAPYGTKLDQAGTIGHILDPRSDTPLKSNITQISVQAESAALADALSTGLCLAANEAQAHQLLRQHKDARLENVQTRQDTT